ncbi:MAG TPA: tetratricopeptide repeat protein, partial [Beijerinckiaceae bacterium]|nr:tetratricopeptide repeat protein [Beijerinckiaceae bacterium]
MLRALRSGCGLGLVAILSSGGVAMAAERRDQADAASASIYFDRGYAHSLKDDFDRAIADFTEAIRLDPKYISALFSRGVTYYNKGDFDRA